MCLQCVPLGQLPTCLHPICIQLARPVVSGCKTISISLSETHSKNISKLNAKGVSRNNWNVCFHMETLPWEQSVFPRGTHGNKLFPTNTPGCTDLYICNLVEYYYVTSIPCFVLCFKWNLKPHRLSHALSCVVLWRDQTVGYHCAHCVSTPQGTLWALTSSPMGTLHVFTLFPKRTVHTPNWNKMRSPMEHSHGY